MGTSLSLVAVREMLPKSKQKKLTQEVLDEVVKLTEDPDYGEELAENYVNFIGALRENPRLSLAKYKAAIMFYTLVESGSALVHAYMQIFPERVEYRKRVYPETDVSVDLAHEASRYNRSTMVMEIRKLDTLSVKLIHRNLLHEAILKQATLMRTAKSELVRQKASETLMRELKPDEGTSIDINIGEGSTKVLQELRQATAALAQEQFMRISQGTPVKDIAASKIIQGESEVISG